MQLAWHKESESPYKAGFRALLKRVFRLPDGREATFDIKDEGIPVGVLAFTPSMEVILARQFRPGPEEVLLEMPGGGTDPGEQPEHAIRRELLEETGFTGDFQFVGTNYHCAYSNALRHTYVATNCRQVQAPAPDELVEVVTVPLPEFRLHLRSGRLTNVDGAYAALDFLKLL